jgi:hypothetical protein
MGTWHLCYSLNVLGSHSDHSFGSIDPLPKCIRQLDPSDAVQCFLDCNEEFMRPLELAFSEFRFQVSEEDLTPKTLHTLVELRHINVIVHTSQSQMIHYTSQGDNSTRPCGEIE